MQSLPMQTLQKVQKFQLFWKKLGDDGYLSNAPLIQSDHKQCQSLHTLKTWTKIVYC